MASAGPSVWPDHRSRRVSATDTGDPADDAILDEPFAGFGHLLVFLLRLQEFTWIADRDRAREGMDMLDGAEHFFNGHAQHRLVDHSQNEDAFEDLAELLGGRALTRSIPETMRGRIWRCFKASHYANAAQKVVPNNSQSDTPTVCEFGKYLA